MRMNPGVSQCIAKKRASLYTGQRMRRLAKHTTRNAECVHATEWKQHSR